MAEIKSFCEFCGNPQRDKIKNVCEDMSCYWYSGWMVDKENPESVKNKNYIEDEIKDMNW